MKTAIVLLSVLIVGTNAGLLGPVTNILDGATATAKLNQLISSLKNQISQSVLDATNQIDEPLAEVANALGELNTEVLAAGVGLSDDASTQIQSTIALIANLEIQNANTLLVPALNKLNSDLTALVNPQSKR